MEAICWNARMKTICYNLHWRVIVLRVPKFSWKLYDSCNWNVCRPGGDLGMVGSLSTSPQDMPLAWILIVLQHDDIVYKLQSSCPGIPVIKIHCQSFEMFSICNLCKTALPKLPWQAYQHSFPPKPLWTEMASWILQYIQQGYLRSNCNTM